MGKFTTGHFYIGIAQIFRQNSQFSLDIGLKKQILVWFRIYKECREFSFDEQVLNHKYSQPSEKAAHVISTEATYSEQLLLWQNIGCGPQTIFKARQSREPWLVST